MGTLPSEVKTAVITVGVMAIGAAAVLVIAANQRQLAGRIATHFLDRISFLDSGIWSKRFDSLLLGLDTLTRPKDALTLLGLSVVVWIPIIAGYYYGMKAVNLQPSLVESAFIVCIAAFSVAAPSSPGQVGVFEAGVTFAMTSILGWPKVESASFAFVYHASNYVILGILGVIGIMRTGMTFQNLRDSTRKLDETQVDDSEESVEEPGPSALNR